MWKIAFVLAMSLAVLAQEAHRTLPLGSSAPDFALPGVDGKLHKLSDYASSPILVVVFTCNHCPIAQMYEKRIQKLTTTRTKAWRWSRSSPTSPAALRIDELDSSDVSDSLA